MAVEFKQIQQGKPGPITPEVLSRSYELAVGWATGGSANVKNFRTDRYDVLAIGFSSTNEQGSDPRNMTSNSFKIVDSNIGLNAVITASDNHLMFHIGRTLPLGMRRTRTISYDLGLRTDMVYYGCVNDVSNLHVLDKPFPFGRFLGEYVNNAAADLNLIVGGCLGLNTIPENHQYYWDKYL